jgi:hypothetical protein
MALQGFDLFPLALENQFCDAAGGFFYGFGQGRAQL